MEIKIDEQVLDRINKGTNFINFTSSYNEKKYFIEVILETTQNLREKEEEIQIKTNLPIRTNSYWRDYEMVDFLKDLKEFVSYPLGKIVLPNKSQIGHYELNDIERHIRQDTIDFKDIEFSIGILAKKKLESFKMDFIQEVKEILELQNDEDKTQKKINAYVSLREKISTLKKLLCKENDYGYCRYDKNKDDTIKLPLSPEEYNSKLKEIEEELRVLEKEFDLEETRLEYIKIAEKKDFDTWLKEHEEELKDNFEENDDENTTFNEYAELVFSEFDEGDE